MVNVILEVNSLLDIGRCGLIYSTVMITQDIPKMKPIFSKILNG